MSTLNPTEGFARHLEYQSHHLISHIATLNAALEKSGFPLIDGSNFEKRLERQNQTAKKPFTVCFYGSFNSGKSTIINALLGLTGEARLSSENSPDTAKSIRIQHRNYPNSPEVTVRFKGGRTKEMSWKECKKLTSQVHLKLTPEDGMLAGEIEEVNYFVPENDGTSLISLCDIIDLPGTGAAEGDLHDEIANERIRESELIFWIIPTHRPEVDINELRNLQSMKSINAQVIPIVNVWQDKAQNVRSKIDPEDVRTSIEDHFRRHFKAPPVIFSLYAREAERAFEKEGHPEEYTGYQKFISFLQSNFFNLENRDRQRTNRIRRIANVMNGEVENLLEQSAEVHSAVDKKLDQIKVKDKAAEVEYNATKKILSDFKTQVEPMANVTADKMIDIFIECTERFIRKKTSGINLGLIRRMINKEEENERLKEEFETRYLELNDPTAPISIEVRVFLKKAMEEAQIRWQRFLEYDDPDLNHSTIIQERVGVFIENLADDLGAFSNNRNVDVLIAGVFALGPTGILMGLIGLILKRIIGKNQEQILEEALLDARLQIKRNRTGVANHLLEKAVDIHFQIQKEYRDSHREAGKNRKQEQDNLLGLKESIGKMDFALNAYQQEMKDWIAVSPIQN